MCRSNREIKRIKLSNKKKCACIVSGYNTFHTFLLNCFLFSFVVKKLLHGKKIRFKLKHLGFFFVEEVACYYYPYRIEAIK